LRTTEGGLPQYFPGSWVGWILDSQFGRRKQLRIAETRNYTSLVKELLPRLNPQFKLCSWDARRWETRGREPENPTTKLHFKRLSCIRRGRKCTKTFQRIISFCFLSTFSELSLPILIKGPKISFPQILTYFFPFKEFYYFRTSPEGKGRNQLGSLF